MLTLTLIVQTAVTATDCALRNYCKQKIFTEHSIYIQQCIILWYTAIHKDDHVNTV